MATVKSEFGKAGRKMAAEQASVGVPQAADGPEGAQGTNSPELADGEEDGGRPLRSLAKVTSTLLSSRSGQGLHALGVMWFVFSAWESTTQSSGHLVLGLWRPREDESLGPHVFAHFHSSRAGGLLSGTLMSARACEAI